MGDHVFLSPEVDGSLDRLLQERTGPLSGAIPPDYLKNKVRTPDPNGPASLLWDGSFCGHGEPTYGVFDLAVDGAELFEIRMTGYDEEGMIISPPYIEARIAGRPGAEWFPIYDTRKHPASTWVWADVVRREKNLTDDSKVFELVDDPKVLDSLPVPELKPYTHEKCNGSAFRVSVGFEYPVDCTGPNDATWFALVIQSPDGNVAAIIFDDETG